MEDELMGWGLPITVNILLHFNTVGRERKRKRRRKTTTKPTTFHTGEEVEKYNQQI